MVKLKRFFSIFIFLSSITCIDATPEIQLVTYFKNNIPDSVVKLTQSLAEELTIETDIIYLIDLIDLGKHQALIYDNYLFSALSEKNFNLIFINPDFFESLTEGERRFAIGRWLLHLEYLAKNKENTPLNFFLNSFGYLGLSACLSILFNNIRLRPRFYQNNRFGFSLALLPFIVKEIIKYGSEDSKLDIEAASRLNEFDGAISYLTNYGNYYSFDGDDYKKRIVALQKLK